MNPDKKKKPVRTWGFRLSATDVIVLLGAAGLAFYTHPRILAWSWGFLIIPLHFFLFCNVFRIRRQLEYIWTVVFFVTVFVCRSGGMPMWHWIFAIQTPVTAFLIWSEMRMPWYHGIFARRLNPRLEEYLRGGEK